MINLFKSISNLISAIACVLLCVSLLSSCQPQPSYDNSPKSELGTETCETEQATTGTGTANVSDTSDTSDMEGEADGVSDTAITLPRDLF